MEQGEFKGDLKWISPDKIIKEGENNEVGGFFVVLGTIFNDLKDIILFENLVIEKYRKPKADECSDHSGNYNGIMIHLNKLIASIINEFFVLLKENKNVLDTTEFKDILSRIPKSEQETWNGMVAAANDQLLELSDFVKSLIRIRNNLAFHYYQSGKMLSKGFVSKFSNEYIDERNRKAYYSIGENVEETRFYFSDAAVEEALSIEAGKEEKKKIIGDESFARYQQQLIYTVRVMNTTMSFLLKRFLQMRRNQP